MTHHLDELLRIVYEHYPRGIESEDPRRRASAEHARLVAARKLAGADPRWRALLRRVSDRYPGRVMSHSLHLPTGDCDACYSFTIDMPAPHPQCLWFHTSFIAPCHVAYVWRRREDTERTAALRAAPVQKAAFVAFGMRFVLPRSAVPSELIAELDVEQRHAAPVERDELLFVLPPEDQTIADEILDDVRATFGTEFLSPEVGATIVPDVSTDSRLLGEATLWDCLFSDGPRWVSPPPKVETVSVDIDVSRVPASVLSVAAVLRAAAAIWLRTRTFPGPVYCALEMSGAPGADKGQMLYLLAEAQKVTDSPAAEELMVAARDLEALVTAWDAAQAPPAALVARALELSSIHVLADVEA
jgi:hypothetical protein